MIVLSSILVALGAYLSGYMLYWYLLLFTHFVLPARHSPPGALTTRFAVLIPAHDEELLLPRLLESAQKQDYPRQLFTVFVVADNCSDRTADVARQHGAIALERVDASKRGKGYAIRWALDSMKLEEYDAVLIVDADCIIHPNTLRSLDGTLQEKRAIQCYSGVGNPDDSWFTRLLDVSRTISNRIYHPAKRRLGLSCHLIGTGMCFATGLLRAQGWDAFTVGEDLEYYARLLDKGESVGFDGNARVYHVESSSLKQATSQRMRWSSGRLAVAWSYGANLLLRGAIERNLVKLDAGLSLVLPNPSLGMNLTLLGLACALVLGATGHGIAFAVWFGVLALTQLGIFMIGVCYTEDKLKKLMAVFLAPAFLAWKFGIDALSIFGVGRKKWVRTERKL